MVLRDQVALVTGASRGIGRAIAVALAQAGAKVAVNYFSSREDAEEVAEAIRRAGSEALLLPADVADQAAVEKMVADTAARFGRLDIAVANAYYSDRQYFYEAEMAGFRRTIDVTMWGQFHTIRAAAQQMLKQPKLLAPAGGERQSIGTIISISSPHAYLPIPTAMAYNMAKAAIDQMIRTAAIELAEHRIRVNTVVPGWTDTPGERKYATEETIQKSGPKLPWGRLGHPDEVARAVVFMCDPASEYITGASLLIDGGITLPWWANRGSGVPA